MGYNSDVLKTVQQTLAKAVAIRGSEFLSEGTTVTGRFTSFVVNAELTLAAITSDDPDMQTFVGEILSPGTLVVPADGKPITSIESTTGNAVLYK